MRNKICVEVRNSGHFTLMVDETRDISKKEQVSIVVRYVKASAVYESFLAYVTAHDITAEGLLTLITNTLSQHNLPLSMCVCQSYDRTSVMSGRLSGVQARMRKLCPQAIYMHCFAHWLNLVLVDCLKNVEFVSKFFSVYQMLYLFLSSSAVLPVFEEVQRVASIKKPLRIKSLGNTRWACHFDAVSGVLQSLKEIVATLEDLTENDRDSKRRVEAGGFLTHVRTFGFIFILDLLVKGLPITKRQSDQLQDDSLDLAAAVELVDSVLSSIRSSRSDKEWERTWKASVDLAERLGIAVVDVRRKGKKRNSQRLLTDMVVLDTTGRRDVAGDDSIEENEEATTKHYYRAHVYNPVIDSWVGELQRRFSEENREIMNSIQACSPRSGKNFLSSEKLMPLATRYGVNETALMEEQCKQAMRILSGKQLTGISDVLFHFESQQEVVCHYCQAVDNSSYTRCKYGYL